MWAGVGFVWRHGTLLTMTVVGAITFMATETAAVADLPLIHHFGVGGVGYGIINVVWGAGGLAGSLVAARVVTGRSEPAAAVLGCLVFGAFVAAVGASPWFALIPLFTLLFASSDSFAFVGFNGIYQRRTPDADPRAGVRRRWRRHDVRLGRELRVRGLPRRCGGLAPGLPRRRPGGYRLRGGAGPEPAVDSLAAGGTRAGPAHHRALTGHAAAPRS